ncbi:unnamed protein product [Lupinus luteus]|uniref:Uncharacterized protein n=1 Tax=Lupinus luteus TaxID=3873 RepID=A0AAV1VYQ1_LUPLU
MIMVIELSAHNPSHVRLVSFRPPAFNYGSCVAYPLSGIHVPLMNRSIEAPSRVFPWKRCMQRMRADESAPLTPFDLWFPLNNTLSWCWSVLTVNGGNTCTSSKGVDGCFLVDPANSHMLAKDVFINQEQKLGARRRSYTVLVSTINDADQGSSDVAFSTPLAPYEKSKSLGSGGNIAIVGLQRGIPSKRESSARVDYVPALCTHHPSILLIEWFGEVFGLRQRGRFAAGDIVRIPLNLII